MTAPPVCGMRTQGSELHTLTGHTGAIVGVSYSPDGTTVATASWDRTARVWDVNTGSRFPHVSPGIRMRSTAYRLVRIAILSQPGVRTAPYSCGNSILLLYQMSLNLRNAKMTRLNPQDAKKMSRGIILLTSKTLYWSHQILGNREAILRISTGMGLSIYRTLSCVAGALDAKGNEK